MSILTPPARRIDPRGQRFGAVTALQALLAATGVCVGCRLYVLRWWVPSAFARLLRRTDQLVGVKDSAPIRYTDR